MRRFTQIIVMAGLTLAATAGNAMALDLRSPDARDAAKSTSSVIDLRSPDARDAAKSTSSVIDMRSPDGRDGARSSDLAQAAADSDLRSPDARDGTRVATYTPGVAPTTHVVRGPTTSFQWGDAGIGAAGMLGLIALCGGMLLVLGSRRRERRMPPAIG
jgi:hypothetical protein